MDGSATDLGLSLFRMVDDLQRQVAALHEEVAELRTAHRERTTTPRQKLRIGALLERHPEITEGQLRAWIFARESNGLRKSGALSKPGKTWLVDEERFLRWMETRGC